MIIHLKIWSSLYMVAGPGVAPGTEDYESSVILFYYPAIDIYANTMCRIYYFTWSGMPESNWQQKVGNLQFYH